jgi:hypothetical protein
MMDIGSVLGGRYKLNARVGEGGMATVYDAEDLLLGRRVAVKIPLPSFAADPAFATRFENEARAAAALTHPNLVNVYDVGESEGTRFIVMEFVEGETLKDLIRREGPLLPEDVVQVGQQMGDALDTAHRRGLIHRDVKPQNILLTPEGRVKLTDFGIALALGADSATRTGTLLGSVQYLAPEIARGESATPLSDVYALGVVLYEMCTAQLPYAGDTPLAIALQHVEGEPRPLHELNPDVPPVLEAIILRAMAKQPADRYPTAASLADALRAFARGEPVDAATGEVSAAGAGMAGTAAPGTAPGAAPAGVPPGQPSAPVDPAATQIWSWGQPAVPSPWAAGQTGAASAYGQTAPTSAYGPSTAVTPYAAGPAAPTYPSARWPLVLLGFVSLLCVLGLVPVGMLAYRQMRLPPAVPRVAPTGGVIPALDNPALAAVQRVPEAWAAAARTLVPVPGATRAVAATAETAERDEGWQRLVGQAAGLARTGLQTAGDTLLQRLSEAATAASCEAVPRPGVAPPAAQACDAPDAMRGR